MFIRSLTLFLVALTCIPATGHCQSRDRRRKDDRPSEAALEIRLKKAEEALISEYQDAAVQFYEQGNREKSIELLQRLKTLNPKLNGLDKQMKQISEEMLQDNAHEFDFDTRKSWELVGSVQKAKAIRIAAEGSYKLTYAGTLSAAGFQAPKPQKNIPRDYHPSAPLGCLMALIVVDGAPGKPFPIRQALEHTPEKSGQLYIKVNVPPGTRCTGRLKIKVSGHLARPKQR